MIESVIFGISDACVISSILEAEVEKNFFAIKWKREQKLWIFFHKMEAEALSKFTAYKTLVHGA